jgi:hypothetical protein
MGTVKVYKYKRPYDSKTDDDPVALRMGTAAFIERIGGTIIKDTELEVDASEVDEVGKMKIGFK